MSDEDKRRTPAGSTIRVRVEVTDREDGTFTDTEVAIAEITERVAHAATGDRYQPVLPTIESVAREAINKALAQVVATEHLAELREGAVTTTPEPKL